MIENCIEIMVPLLIVGAGALIAERSGITNIALEGFILWGAFAGFMAFQLSGSLAITFWVVLAGTLLPAGFFAISVFLWGGDIYLSGLAFNILLPGIISLLSAIIYHTNGPIRLQGGSNLPISSTEIKILFSLLPLLLIATHLFLTKSYAGTLLKITGGNSQFISIHIGHPRKIQAKTLIYSSLLAALAGMILSLRIGGFLPGISSGRGWIALILLYIGRKNAGGFFAATLIFALAEATSMELQGRISLQADLVLGIPFFLALSALLISPLIAKFLTWKNSNKPLNKG